MKKERIKTKLKNARVTLTRHRKQLVNDTSVQILSQTAKGSFIFLVKKYFFS